MDKQPMTDSEQVRERLEKIQRKYDEGVWLQARPQQLQEAVRDSHHAVGALLTHIATLTTQPDGLREAAESVASRLEDAIRGDDVEWPIVEGIADEIRVLAATPPTQGDRLKAARRQLDSLQPIVRDLERVVTATLRVRAAYPDAITDEVVDRVTLEFMAPPAESAPEDEEWETKPCEACSGKGQDPDDMGQECEVCAGSGMIELAPETPAPLPDGFCESCWYWRQLAGMEEGTTVCVNQKSDRLDERVNARDGCGEWTTCNVDSETPAPLPVPRVEIRANGEVWAVNHLGNAAMWGRRDPLASARKVSALYDDCPIIDLTGDQPTERPKIVCLCGSTKFKDAYLDAALQATMAGFIVVTVHAFGHAEGIKWTDNEKTMLDELHLRKIDLADEVHILNVGGYIGDSTRREIAYAEKHGKTVTYLETGDHHTGSQEE